MRLDPDGFSIKELMQRLDDGKIALPEFQRDFEWRPPAVAELLVSVARKWPIGSFLLLEVDDPPPFAIRPLTGAPSHNKPDRLILDGQQRSTAIYQACGEHSRETYFVMMRQVLEEQALDDDHLLFEKSTKFVKAYPTLQAMADARVVKVATIVDPVEWQTWLNYLPEAERGLYVEAKEKHLPGFSGFDIPALRLEKGAKENLAAIAKIFETINRTGKRLATFDLMVARLYPEGFHLKSAWEDATAKFGVFDRFGFDEDDGIEILKLIALREHLREREAGGKLTIKGVRESDVLELNSLLVIGEWPLAVRAMVNALEFVRDECGAVRRLTLPAPAMLLVLAALLHTEEFARDGLRDDLVRWYWATMFRQDYAQGANTQAVSDARELRAWQADSEKTPQRISGFRVDREALIDGRRRNEQLLRGLLSLSVVRDARDWAEDKRFRDLDGPLEAHHVFPADYLKDHYRGEKDPVANFALLTKSTNAALRDKLPRDVLIDGAIKPAAISSHPGINVADFKQDADVESDPEGYVTRFLANRADALEALMYEVVGVPRPLEP